MTASRGQCSPGRGVEVESEIESVMWGSVCGGGGLIASERKTSVFGGYAVTDLTVATAGGRPYRPESQECERGMNSRDTSMYTLSQRGRSRYLGT